MLLFVSAFTKQLLKIVGVRVVCGVRFHEVVPATISHRELSRTSLRMDINSRRHFGITCDKELVINAILHSASILRTSSIQQPVSCSMNRLLSIRLTRTIWLMDNMTSQLACFRHVTVQIGISWRIFAAHYVNWLSLMIHFFILYILSS